MTEAGAALNEARSLAERYIESLGTRAVGGDVDLADLRESLGGPLADEPRPPDQVVRELADGVERGLVATSSGRFFGFVEGGTVPAALAADWLASTWDQNPGFYVLSPAAAVVEEIAAIWLLDVLGLPASASVGFTTGAQMASVAALAAARHHVLSREGWDVEADGMNGAPPVSVLVGEERHATIGRALRFLGFGEKRVEVVAVDDQGRMDPGSLRAVLSRLSGPTIVCAQAGNVNTGSFDPLRTVAESVRESGAWLHVDGAFGLWAAAAPELRHLVDGVELADSWATDGHKWLNVPYDSGFVICAHPESHRTAMALRAPYLIRDPEAGRDGSDWTPESSRRARAFAVWAALRSLGRNGVTDLVQGCCDHARRIAGSLSARAEFEILNDVVLNQVLVRVAGQDETTLAVAREVQRRGRVWLADTVWKGTVAIRISVSDHATSDTEATLLIDELVAAAAVIGG